MNNLKSMSPLSLVPTYGTSRIVRSNGGKFRHVIIFQSKIRGENISRLLRWRSRERRKP